MDIRAQLESLDPEAPDFEARVAAIEAELEKERRRERVRQIREQLVEPQPEARPESKSAADALWEDGRIGDIVRSAAAVNVATTFDVTTLSRREKALLTNPGDIARQLPDVVAPTSTLPSVRDVLGPIALGPGERSVDFVRETGYTVSADVVAEGAAKPESSLTLEAKTEAAKAIAHHIPVTRQALASRASMQRYVERRLIEGLLGKVDDKLLNGAGGGTDVPGYLTDPAIPTVNTGSDRVARIVRAAIDLMKQKPTRVVPTGVVISPDDFVEVALQKDTNGQYVFPEFRSADMRSAHSLPFISGQIVITPYIAAGTALVGAFGQASALYEVATGTIRATESHADEFVKNIVRILAEVEIVHAIELPSQGFRAVSFAGL